MKKGYHDYIPVVKKQVKVKEKKQCSFTGLIHSPNIEFITEDVFQLQFGFEYPKVYTKPEILKTYKYPKTDGSNGKISRFR